MDTEVKRNIRLAHIPKGDLTQKQARAIFARQFGKTHDLHAMREDEKSVEGKLQPVWAAMLLEKVALDEDDLAPDSPPVFPDDTDDGPSSDDDEGDDKGDLVGQAMDLLGQLQDVVSQLDKSGDDEEAPAELDEIPELGPPLKPFSSFREKEAGLTKEEVIKEARQLAKSHPDYKGFRPNPKTIKETKTHYEIAFEPVGK